MADRSIERALVVFSGGQDSTTCLYWALERFDVVEAITFDYGQRHRVELECAERICRRLGVRQTLVPMDFLAALNPSAMTDATKAPSLEGGMKDLPNTFVPGRNILFLTLAASYAIPRGFDQIVMGVCETDFSGYPDCREEFVAAMERALSLGLDSKITVHRPLMHLDKAETFALAAELGVLESVIEDSHTCYVGERERRFAWGYGCGQCPACRLRRRGYEEYSARVVDGDFAFRKDEARAEAEALMVDRTTEPGL